MYKKYLFYSLLIFFTIIIVQAEGREISLSITPGVEIPMGPQSSDGEDLYDSGFSVVMAGEMPLSEDSPFFGSGMLDYGQISTVAETTLSLLSLEVGTGINFEPTSVLGLKLAVGAGWGLGLYEGESGSNPVGIIRGTASFNFTPSFSLGISGGYKYLYDIYNGINAGLTLRFVPGSGTSRSKLEIPEIQFIPVFPVFYSYYDENPLGAVSIQNLENGSIKNVKVSLFVKQYMDSPKLCATLPEMAKNEEMRIPLLALFSENILSITEGTKAAADVIIEYEYQGKERSKTGSATIQMYDRNAMTWDDDRKAASFVTAKDPAVLRFAKSVAGETRSSGSDAVNTNFRIALGLFQALSLYGINYVVDPTTPYADFSQNKFSLDYLQFPSQTLTYKAGDCDDLSILYAALLKSVGIEAAFVTVPGHIYTAISLDMEPDEAKKTFREAENLIFTEDNSWVPVEITMVKEGFLKAWETGASQWRGAAKDKRGFFPMDEAWQVYKPVGSPGGDVVDAVPPESRVLLASYRSEMDTFIKREIESQVASLKRDIAAGGNNSRLINKLGVLYARYGFYDEAEAEFQKISSSYTPAMINLGNISYQKNDMLTALRWYDRALERAPESRTALLGSARANYEIENFGSVKLLYTKLEEVDSRLAGKYAYLVSASDDTGRASSAVLKESALWEEQ